MKRGLGVNKQVILADLERAKSSFEATVIGITPSNIKNLREKYNLYVAKYEKFKPLSSYRIDGTASEVIERNSIVLEDNVRF